MKAIFRVLMLLSLIVSASLLPGDVAADVRSDDDILAETLQRYASATVNDINSFWSDRYSNYDSNVSVVIVGRDHAAQTNCGPAGDPETDPSYSPAFYCISGGETAEGFTSFPTIYLSEPWIGREAQKVHPDNFEFAIATILAHEVGHHVQHQMGLFDSQGYPVEGLYVKDTELHADCLAGTWARELYYNDRLAEGDDVEAMDIVINAGSDIPFPPGDPQDHGTPTDRLTAWQNGFFGVTPGHCEDTYLS